MGSYASVGPVIAAWLCGVPVVLHEGDVKTLDPKLLERVDKLASPRLVEYWEQDPCNPRLGYGARCLRFPFRR